MSPYSFANESLGDVLLDLAVRFILNCPKEDLSTAERLFFQIEEAHWFYEDFCRVDNTALPSMKLRTFVDKFFSACPILYQFQSDPLGALTSFQSYKSFIPVRGGIILNEALDKVLMVKGWKSSSSWGFPKGKINKDEPDETCAIREVYEETGFDMTPYIKSNDYLEVTRQGKNIRLYIIRGVPENTQFVTQTRKEISKIKWHQVSKLPFFNKKVQDSNYYMAVPFMNGLKKYINKCKGLATSLSSSETDALKNVLGSDKLNDDEAAKKLLSLLKPQKKQESADTDRETLLNLLKGTSKTSQLENAQQVLGLFKTEINAENVLAAPTKVTIPSHYSSQVSCSNEAPPVPPNSMLESLVSKRRQNAKAGGLLSILSGSVQSSGSQNAPIPASSNNVNRGLEKDLMDLLQKPKGRQEQGKDNPIDLLALLEPGTKGSKKGDDKEVPEKETPEKAKSEPIQLLKLLEKQEKPAANLHPSEDALEQYLRKVTGS